MGFRKYFALGWAPLEKWWARLIGDYCIFVARHPWYFLIGPLVITLLLSSGIIFRFKIVRGVHYLYAPLDARWKSEEAVFGNNWASDDDHFYPGKDLLRRRGLYLIVEAKDGGSVLRQEESKEFLRILHWITTTNFTASSHELFSYKDICLHFQNDCFANAHAKLIADVFAKRHQADLNITYPTYRTRFATEPIDVSRTLGNVSVGKNDELRTAGAWFLLFQLKQHSPRMAQLSADFENLIAKAIDDGQVPTHLLCISYFHSETFEQELAKENRRITPMFSVTFTVLIIFSILCTFNVKWISVPKNILGSWNSNRNRVLPVIDWVLSKPLMGVVGVLSTLMAIVSSTGLLLLLDVTFVDMCTVMPFLSLTIGIDDTFLMLAAWHETTRGSGIFERIDRAMRHAAVSISITSLTDALAFFIGAFAPLPAVIYFCYYSCAAIIFIFAYCLTVFVAALSLQGRLEEKNLNSLTMKPVCDVTHLEEKLTIHDLVFNMGSIEISADETGQNNNDVEFKSPYTIQESQKDIRMWYHVFFEDHYALFISQSWMAILTLTLFLTYTALAFTGAQSVVVGFDLINIVQASSPSRRFLETRSRFFPEDLSCMDVAVMRPPNMANTIQRDHFMQVLREFEETPCSSGRNSTVFWFFSFEEYMSSLGFGDSWEDVQNDNESFMGNLRSFLVANDKFAYDVLSRNELIQAFRLSTGLVNITTDENIYNCAHLMRDICDKHPEYGLSTYTPMWNIADQFEIMWPQTMQDLYISIVVMVCVAILFIPQPLCSLVIALNIASVAMGVIGFMGLWNVNLDATSMITIAMSVGFSVDFAAHVSYAYMTGEVKRKSATDPALSRLCCTLGTVGWPISQASFSVLLGVSSLYAVDSYVVQTCFKTVLLVIVFGTVHALLFLPLVLMHAHKIYLFLSQKIVWSRQISKTAPVDVQP